MSNNYEYLPINWILVPEDSNSLKVISLYMWSTKTVVVASGAGYYSNSTYGSININFYHWLTSYFSTYSYVYACWQCNCEILIMYWSYPSTLTPSYSPVVYSDPYPAITSTTTTSSSYIFLILFWWLFVS